MITLTLIVVLVSIAVVWATPMMEGEHKNLWRFLLLMVGVIYGLAFLVVVWVAEHDAQPMLFFD